MKCLFTNDSISYMSIEVFIETYNYDALLIQQVCLLYCQF